MGRPKGSKNKPKPVATATIRRRQLAELPRVVPVKDHPGRWHCVQHGEYAGRDADCMACRQEPTP